MKNQLSLLCFAIFFFTANYSVAQTGSVKGQVLDTNDQPLQGATVLIDGTNLGSATDSEGHYSINDVPVGEQTLIVRFIGFATVKRKITIEDGVELEVNVTLSADLLGLDEVVVSGTFNPATKLESSTSITTLDPQHIGRRLPTGTADLLNAVPGLQVTSNYGTVGADVTVRGLPLTENSSFRYISLQEDGLPAFEVPGLLFAFPDAMVRHDETVNR
ncbi:MAG TPA: carboxypeptidase-like regulatory domain-containing protein, partial [Balneolaceae bacterium]|nr:carboxypeptidase-like regulatory domain-containing protein [Balneolaceae bacterium]